MRNRFNTIKRLNQLPSLNMYRLVTICLILSAVSCGKYSAEDFQENAAIIERRLINDLKLVNGREELVEITPKLKKRFYELVDLIIQSDECAQKHPQEEFQETSEYVDRIGYILRDELERIYAIDGCREIIEKCQEGALDKLDRYRQRLRVRKM